MRTTTLRLYSLEYKQAKTYLAVALFVAGNIFVGIYKIGLNGVRSDVIILKKTQ